MKANDLMIGDYVGIEYFYYENGQVIADKRVMPCNVIRIEDYKVTLDRQDGKIQDCLINDIVPIPLTEEILVKNGFHIHKNDGKWLGQEARFHLPTDEDVLVLMLDNIGYHVSISWGFHPHFHYVHELQHLFHICGIEKEIIL